MVVPLVLLIDLDGTMQGDIRPQLQEYDIVRRLNRRITQNKKVRLNVSDFENDMRTGLMRPYLAECLRAIRRTHAHVELFLYTASTTEWAHYVVNRIERNVFGEQVFNRPYLTRKHCSGTMSKSIERVFPIIARTLRNKYQTVSKDRVFLIDNNPVLPESERRHLILCPTYEYVRVIDPMRAASSDILHLYHLEFAEMLGVPAGSTSFETLARIYTQLHAATQRSGTTNKPYRNDTYWKRVARIFLRNPLVTNDDVRRAVAQLRALV